MSRVPFQASGAGFVTGFGPDYAAGIAKAQAEYSWDTRINDITSHSVKNKLNTARNVTTYQFSIKATLPMVVTLLGIITLVS